MVEWPNLRGAILFSVREERGNSIAKDEEKGFEETPKGKLKLADGRVCLEE